MIAIANDHSLHLLEFSNRKNINTQLQKFTDRITQGHNTIIDTIENELDDYFKGNLTHFKTPITFYGTPFQKSVMEILVKIPHGETITYKDQAIALENPRAIRAVARANGTNQIAIVIPCHRVIGSNGKLTGYAGGLKRKDWLLNHERKYTT